ncbi:prolyl-tRNA synthetase associated domain-containing protein [Magnetovibrio sp. PR-2]|uniref:prolyl-tRNA synthetase associated domain-containing protein n=1 Tax=Magnetovibrio sp. PR-2 TaxID=3120356 RepID=UPI002FCE531D
MTQITPSTSDELLQVLTNLGIAHLTHEHEALMTVEQSQALRGSIPGLHSKNLFLKNKKGALWLIVAEEQQDIQLNPLRKHLKAGNWSFANADLLMQHLGVTPGSVTPFGTINDTDLQVHVILDETLAKADKVNFHPLINTRSTTLSGPDLLRFFDHTGHKPLVLNFDTINCA